MLARGALREIIIVYGKSRDDGAAYDSATADDWGLDVPGRTPIDDQEFGERVHAAIRPLNAQEVVGLETVDINQRPTHVLECYDFQQRVTGNSVIEWKGARYLVRNASYDPIREIVKAMISRVTT